MHRVTSSDGTLVYGWRPFTAREKADFVSGRSAPKTAAVRLAAKPDGELRAESASGCSENVCITIVGTGLFIQEWRTSALYGGNYICTRSRWWHQYRNDPPPGWLERTGNGVCGGAGVFFSDWFPKRNFPTGIACNTWDYIVGRPCESITL
ncbi:MAG: hypothetical protein H0X35_09250 [Pseudonocardiales bacterium]|nr:hypothetical protein [Pseudonocardiales bacterium]